MTAILRFLSCIALVLWTSVLSGTQLAHNQSESSQVVQLEGPWKFYWKQLLEPSSKLPPPDLSIELGTWNGLQLPSGETIASFGYATYSRETPPLDQGKEYTIRVRAVGSSGKILVYHPDHPESFAVQEIGRVAQEDSVSTKRLLSVSFRAQHSGEHRILIQVANHRNHKGGIWGGVEIGEAQVVRQITMINDLANILVVGISLTVAIHSLLTWLRDRSYRIGLLLALIGLGGIIRVLGTSHYFAEILPNSFDFLLRKCEYLSIPWALVYLFFLKDSFGARPWENRCIYALICFCTPLILLTLLTPVYIFSQVLPLYQLAILLVACLSLTMTLRAFKEKQQGVLLVLLSIVFFCAFIANDIFLVSIYSRHGIYTFPLGIAICLILNLILLTQRAAEAQAMAHYLSSERESIQRELRLEVESRFHLASQVAHKLNNPLNYISTASVYIQGQIHRLQEEVLALFVNADPNDPELREAEEHFRARLQGILEPLQELRKGVDLAAGSVLEIRSLSGIDGTNLQAMDLGECILQIMNALYEKHPQIRNRIAPQLMPIHQAVYVDFHSLKSGLELALGLDPHFPHQLLHWRLQIVEEADSPVMGIIFAWQPTQVITEEACRDKESQANHLLKRFHAKIQIHTRHPEFSIEILLPKKIFASVEQTPLTEAG